METLRGHVSSSLESLSCSDKSTIQSNILIDEAHHARLADFCLLTVTPDPTNLLSSSSHTRGGTVRWMSPELIHPEEFGSKKSLPTKPSDCYALGMAVYETISGNLPFYGYTDSQVALKVAAGERPPRGVMFTETLWDMLKSCWASQPDDRPSTEEVLSCLKNACDGRDSLHCSSGIATWANDTTTRGGTSTSSPLGCVTHRMLDPVSPESRQSTTKPTTEASKADLNHPDLSTSQVVWSNEGIYQVSII